MLIEHIQHHQYHWENPYVIEICFDVASGRIVIAVKSVVFNNKNKIVSCMLINCVLIKKIIIITGSFANCNDIMIFLSSYVSDLGSFFAHGMHTKHHFKYLANDRCALCRCEWYCNYLACLFFSWKLKSEFFFVLFMLYPILFADMQQTKKWIKLTGLKEWQSECLRVNKTRLNI